MSWRMCCFLISSKCSLMNHKLPLRYCLSDNRIGLKYWRKQPLISRTKTNEQTKFCYNGAEIIEAQKCYQEETPGSCPVQDSIGTCNTRACQPWNSLVRSWNYPGGRFYHLSGQPCPGCIRLMGGCPAWNFRGTILGHFPLFCHLPLPRRVWLHHLYLFPSSSHSLHVWASPTLNLYQQATCCRAWPSWLLSVGSS